MKSSTFEVEGKVPSFNQLIYFTKRSWAQYSNLKRTWTEKVSLSCIQQEIPSFNTVHLDITWIEKTKRRDPDNIAYAVKFILDGMTKAKVIPSDKWDIVRGISHSFTIGKKHSFVVTLH
jgi:Holliday junction resolvase RusA-like endonuclease